MGAWLNLQKVDQHFCDVLLHQAETLMEEWQKQFFDRLEVAASEVEQFIQEISDEFVEVVESLVELSEEITEHVHNTLFNEFDQFLNQFVGFVLDPDNESENLERVEQPDQFLSYIQPTTQKYPACMGCRNYHGHVYGGQLLVCGMHPYGWEDRSCPDWEGNEMFTSD